MIENISTCFIRTTLSTWVRYTCEDYLDNFDSPWLPRERPDMPEVIEFNEIGEAVVFAARLEILNYHE